MIVLLMHDKLNITKYTNMLDDKYATVVCDNVEDALYLCAKSNVVLVIYEYQFEKTSNISFLDLIWSIQNIPAIVAIANSFNSEEQLEVLNRNVVDLFDNSFDEREISLRLERIYTGNLKYKYGRTVSSEKEGIRLECDHNTCYKNEKTVHLSFVEFAVLNIFISAKNQTFSREFIYSIVFGAILYSSDLRKVDEIVFKLRKILGITSIQSVKTVGYVWQE